MRHIENNHQSKDQKCEFCSTSFANLGKLSRHIKKIHESQRKHKCDSCVKFFSTSANLNIFTLRHYMKDKKITNVILVQNLSLNQDI